MTLIRFSPQNPTAILFCRYITAHETFCSLGVKRTEIFSIQASVHERNGHQLILARIKELIGRDNQCCRNVPKPALSRHTTTLCQADCVVANDSDDLAQIPEPAASFTVSRISCHNHLNMSLFLSPRTSADAYRALLNWLNIRLVQQMVGPSPSSDVLRFK